MSVNGRQDEQSITHVVLHRSTCWTVVDSSWFSHSWSLLFLLFIDLLLFLEDTSDTINVEGGEREQRLNMPSRRIDFREEAREVNRKWRSLQKCTWVLFCVALITEWFSVRIERLVPLLHRTDLDGALEKKLSKASDVVAYPRGCMGVLSTPTGALSTPTERSCTS